MVEGEVVRGRLKLLAEYLDDLRELGNLEWTEFANNKVLRRYVERTLHLAVEACLDVGSHVIASQSLREPDDNKDVFRVLAEEGILFAEQAKGLQKAAGFRNLLVHEYTRIDPAIVFGVLTQNLAELEAFALRMDQWLQQQGV